MTTYTLDPNNTWLAVYNLNTATMPTNNVVFSEITANIGVNDSNITIKTGEGALFTTGMVATIEQLEADGKTATKREVVLISGITDDTLTITRGYEKCVMDDTATPKVMGNTKQAFTAGARISVYVSKALLNGVQTRLQQVNCPCNTQVYNDSLAISSCVKNNCDDWRDKLYSAKASRCYNDCGFGDGSDGDCIISENTFLCANCNYNFRNLTICSGVLVRFEGAGVPRINVQRKFCNMGTIDLRGGTFVGACSKVDGITGCTVSNNACAACYNAMCYGCGGAAGSGYGNGVAGSNATTGAGGAGGHGGCGLTGNVRYKGNYEWCVEWTCDPGTPGAAASGYNGGNGGMGGSAAGDAYCGYYPQGKGGGGGGGGGGGYYTGNGGDGGAAGYAVYNVCRYSNSGNGGNGGIWGKGGKGGGPGNNLSNYCSFSFCYNKGGDGGNGYIGGDGGRGDAMLCYAHGNGGNGGKGVVCGGNGADSRCSTSGRPNNFHAGNGGMAINNMYGLIVHACEYYNNCIMAKGGDGGRGGNAIASDWSGQGSTHGASGGCGGCGGNGANGGHVSVAYARLIQLGSVNVSKGLGGKGGCNRCVYDCVTYCADGTDGSDGRYKSCKPF